MGDIDRRKHDIDVIERVMSGAGEPGDDETSRTDVVQLGVRPWLVDRTSSAVQVTVGAFRKDQEPAAPRPAGGSDEYESDRRGEHTYPEGPAAAPRSHRERDELKSRLERRG